MVITPQTEIILLHVPIEISNKNQLTFSNPNAQFNYFRNLSEQYVEDNCTYLRKNGYAVVNLNYDEASKYNYVMYQNESFSTKWYYAFITKIEYLSHNSTAIYIKTDSFQTYQFDIDYKASFVEREMINVQDDVPGANLLNENLETGEYIEYSQSSVAGLGIVYVLVFGKDPYVALGETYQTDTNGCSPNYYASGLWYYVGNYLNVLRKAKSISDAGFPDDIITIFSVPSIAIYGIGDYTLAELDDKLTYFGTWLTGTPSFDGRNISLSGVHNDLDGYTPKNQKLKTYPFTYLGFTPTNGTSQVLRYEDFANNPYFRMMSEINPNPSVYFIPVNYKKEQGANVSESLIVSGYPMISYHTDFFSGWLAQNSKLIDLSLNQDRFNTDIAMGKSIVQMAGGVGTAVAGGALGNIGAVSQGITSSIDAGIDIYAGEKNYDFKVQETMLNKERQSMLPNKSNVGGSNATLLQYDYFNQDIFTSFGIKNQFARRIDKFFDMYGYLTNELKVPNISNRPNWNYVKTLGLNILHKTNSNVPNEDMEMIKNIFDNGVTLWHNPQTFLDYSQNNR